MRSFLVATEMGLAVHMADVAPEMAADREIAAEPSGLMRMACAWTGAALGVQPCKPLQHGQVSHGMSAEGKRLFLAGEKISRVSK